MMSLFKKRIFLLLVLLSIRIYGVDVNNSLRDFGFVTQNSGIEGSKLLKNASVSFYAINLNTGKVVRSINPTASLIPASSLKLLTTAAGLEILGDDFIFQTVIVHDGEIDRNGILKGNIYIRGGADPTLGSRNFKKHYYEPYFIKVWVDAIRKKGIKTIEGSIIGDPQLYGDYIVPTTWVVEDLGNDYGAGYSGLSIFDNIYEVNFSNLQQPSIEEITPLLPPEVQLINQLKQEGNSCKVCIYGRPYQNTRLIKGTVTPKKANFTVKGSIPDPAYWAAYSLHTELEKYGIKVAKNPTTIRRQSKNTLAQQGNHHKHLKSGEQLEFKVRETGMLPGIHITYSPPLKRIVEITNRESNNLYAEHIANHIGLKVMGEADLETGIKAIMNFWRDAGVDTLGMFLMDGSGLSRYNSVTTKQLVEILCYMRNSKNFQAFYHSLPIAGETGTLKELFIKAPLKGNLRAKTGTLKRVLSYTGYCTNIKGEDIAFSLIINNYNGTINQARSEVEKLLIVLVNEE